MDKTILFGDEAFDEAINYNTGGTIKNKTELVDKFMNDLNGTATYMDFLKDYCDIDLTNADTVAITGSDAGGGSTESIVPESSNPSSWTAPTPGRTTNINGLTVRWPTAGADRTSLTAAEEHIMKGLNSEWIKQSLDLVKETY